MIKLLVFDKSHKLQFIIENLTKEEAEKQYNVYQNRGFYPEIHCYGFYNW